MGPGPDLWSVRDDRKLDENERRKLLRGLPPRAEDRACHAAHADPRRRGALYRALWFALCIAVVRHFRADGWLAETSARRPPRLPHRIRQDGRGHLAERRRQSRL